MRKSPYGLSLTNYFSSPTKQMKNLNYYGSQCYTESNGNMEAQPLPANSEERDVPFMALSSHESSVFSVLWVSSSSLHCGSLR